MKISVETKLNNLTTIVEKGFQRLDSKIDSGFGELDAKIDSRFSELDSKIDDLALATHKGFEEVHQKFEEVYRRFDRLEFQVGGHDRRIENLEDKVLQISTKIGLKGKN